MRVWAWQWSSVADGIENRNLSQTTWLDASQNSGLEDLWGLKKCINVCECFGCMPGTRGA